MNYYPAHDYPNKDCIPFSENLQSLSERLIGPFDIEDVVDPIGVSISEGIMNFQNSGYEITGKVFQDCGTPRLQKRQVGWLRNYSLLRLIEI